MNTFIKLVLIQAALIAFQSILYYAAQKPQTSVHDASRPIDQRIPFVPQAVFIYTLWYPLIAVFPIMLYHYASPEVYLAYISTIIMDIVLSTVVYLAYPTSFIRPQPSTEKIYGKLLCWIYTKGNYKGKNCMPSMHCSMCFLILSFVVGCGGMPVWLIVVICVLCISIIVSTLLTKQHVIVDVIAAIPMAIVCYLIGHWFCRIVMIV